MTEWIVASSALVVVVALVRLIFKGKINPRLQYALWGIVLVRLLLPFPLLDSSMSIMNIVDFKSATYERQINAPVTLPAQAVGANAIVPSNPVSNNGITAEMSPASQKPSLVILTWAVGSVVVGLWFAGANMAFYRRLRKNRRYYTEFKSKLPIYIAEQLVSPCLYGVFRPAVYITPKAACNPAITTHGRH